MKLLSLIVLCVSLRSAPARSRVNITKRALRACRSCPVWVLSVRRRSSGPGRRGRFVDN